MKTKTNDKLKELFKSTSFENYQFEDFASADELIEALQEQITENEIIYYSKAIKYLSENDASLEESISQAADMGYSIREINSELLATLLYRENLNSELSDLCNEIKEIYEESEG